VTQTTVLVCQYNFTQNLHAKRKKDAIRRVFNFLKMALVICCIVR